jgi:hypothetical protein
MIPATTCSQETNVRNEFCSKHDAEIKGGTSSFYFGLCNMFFVMFIIFFEISNLCTCVLLNFAGVLSNMDLNITCIEEGDPVFSGFNGTDIDQLPGCLKTNDSEVQNVDMLGNVIFPCICCFNLFILSKFRHVR